MATGSPGCPKVRGVGRHAPVRIGVFPAPEFAVAAAKSKHYPDAATALYGLVADGQTLAVGGFGLCGIPEALIAALRDSGGQGPDRHLQQCRRRRLRPGPAAGDPADQEDDFVLRGREQGIRTPVPGRRARAGVQPAGHAGRAPARRRCRHPGVLHRHRLRHGGGRRQGNPRDSTASTTCWRPR